MKRVKLTPSIEDYVKTIYDISKKSKVVRVKDLSRSLNVKMPSVVNAVKTLESKGLVKHENYGYIELTHLGERIGKELKNKHDILAEFLIKVLQVDQDIALKDACSIEHYLNPKTVDRVVSLLEFLKSNPEYSRWVEQFRLYLREGKGG